MLFFFFFVCVIFAATHRLYAADITTTDYSHCSTTADIGWYFLANCSFFDSGGVQQQYCNGESVATNSQTFTPPNAGETAFASYFDSNLGDLQYIYMGISSSDAWCLDKIRFLMNDVTNEWKTCDFGDWMAGVWLDTDCSANGGFDSITFDISSSDSICYDDEPPTSYPTGIVCP